MPKACNLVIAMAVAYVSLNHRSVGQAVFELDNVQAQIWTQNSFSPNFD